MSFNKNRVRKLNQENIGDGFVIYWMSRDQRVRDNWALTFAYQLAKQEKKQLIVLFCLQKSFLEATLPQFNWMISGLKEVEKELSQLNIPFVVENQSPEKGVPGTIKKLKAGCLVTDFSPLKIKTNWLKSILNQIKIAVFEVDAHNIVPVWQASTKQEFGAYTIRPKIHKQLSEYLTEFPKLEPFEKENLVLENSSSDLIKAEKTHYSILSGSIEADKVLDLFLNSKVIDYGENRNDPNLDALSNLSPYLHFGQISAQRIALEILNKYPKFSNSKDNTGLSLEQVSANSFLEELVIRRELSDNFCYYNPNYDNFEGFHDWAKTTLNEHRNDSREYLYNQDQFENSQTHDPLWNAAQNQMIKTGKMHGFMRMYWAKKILEWSKSPEDAMEIAIFLNDKYQLDGRDPNGYTGVSWSIGGTHDRAWTERPVFGKIRYMNYNGCKRKFDVNSYINKWNSDISNTRDLLL